MMVVPQAIRYSTLLTLCFTFTYSLLDGYFLENFLANTCDLQDDDVIMTSTSYTECVMHCKGMSECTAVNVMQKSAICRLNFNVNETVVCQGYQYSQKANWKQHDARECDCPREQQCQKNGGCVTSECSKQQAPNHGKLYQQRVRIGDNISYQCKPGYILRGQRTLQCQSDGTWSGPSPTCPEDTTCIKYLVSGPTGVEDDQLSESTNWCEFRSQYPACIAGKEFTSAKFARLNSTGFLTGSWIASSNDVDQYIQVDFLQMRIVSGIALQGRDPKPHLIEYKQWVTRFKVLYSRDCQTFLDITDENGVAEIFDGNTNPTDIVIRNLPKRVVARCTRINPREWHGHISIRFDSVLGC